MDRALSPAEILHGNAQLQQHRVLEIGQRCALLTDHVTTALDLSSATPGDQNRQILSRVSVRIP